ncbi:hypothetical protein TNCV_3988651 [Trichonephila clavipes]|nr:hypothetical protein TNCV_3988651 [Trichonephila clavipes]
MGPCNAVEMILQVWFRKGIDGLHSGENIKDAAGVSWIEMFGILTCISVGIDDQIVILVDLSSNFQRHLYGRQAA